MSTPAADEEPHQQVSIFLLRDRYLSAFQTSFPASTGTQIVLSSELEGYFVPVPDDPAPPSWLSHVLTLLPPGTVIDLSGQHPGGILTLKYKNRNFVLTFGHAWAKLKNIWLEPNFGMRVALNCISRDQLTEVKAEQVFAAWHLSNERSPMPTSVGKFSIEGNRDLVHMIEGRPDATTELLLGSKIRGGVSLKASINFKKLSLTLDLIILLEQKTDYKTKWPEIDNLHLVNDNLTLATLNTNLDTHLKNTTQVLTTILVAPTQKNTSIPYATSYAIGRLTKIGKSGRVSSPYLMIGNWVGYLNGLGKTADLINAHSTPVHFLDEKDQEIAKSSLFDCIGFETTITSATGTPTHYVLSAGWWYEASHNFITTVNAELATLATPSTHPLRPWNGTDVEGVYNASCISPGNGLYLYDAKNVHFGGGQSKFEFCDLFHEPTMTLFFIKHVGASNHLSHLVEQVRRTVELVFGIDSTFRTKLAAKSNIVHPSVSTTWLTANRPRPGDINLCLVSMGRNYSDFPFFAKCGLARLLKDLRKGSHSVSFLSV
ncbi:TIGR04141 family sporadically distributed protein [Janthinobacterium sp. PSPC1-1]|uniref:TIGR04141 family sporadically distributed protein n=1 Tax=Janthinobacterium sp. PSPC1-1 TaxID=2804581 RepID=UPI003CF9CAE3